MPAKETISVLGYLIATMGPECGRITFQDLKDHLLLLKGYQTRRRGTPAIVFDVPGGRFTFIRTRRSSR